MIYASKFSIRYSYFLPTCGCFEFKVLNNVLENILGNFEKFETGGGFVCDFSEKGEEYCGVDLEGERDSGIFFISFGIIIT